MSLHEQLSRKINTLTTAAEYPTTKVGYGGLRRLVESVDAQDAVYYLSEDIIFDLQDMTDDEEMQQAIGSHFTIAEMLRRASVTRDVIESTRQSVAKALEIRGDTLQYLADITDGRASKLFCSLLTPSAILYETTRNLRSVDEVIARNAEFFDELTGQYPLLASTAPEMVYGLVARGSKSEDGRGRVDAECSIIEERLQRAVEDGVDPRLLKHMAHGVTRREAALRYERSKIRHYGKESARVRRRGPRSLTAAGIAHNDALPLSAYGTLEQGTEYHEIIAAVNHYSRAETQPAVDEVFNIIDDVRQEIGRICDQLPQDDRGIEYAQGVQRAFEERITEIASLVPSLMHGVSESAIITCEGATDHVHVQSLDEVAQSLKVLQYMVAQIRVGYDHEFGATTVGVHQGIGRFESTVAPLAVTIRPEGDARCEARMGWRVMMPPSEQEKIFGSTMCPKSLPLTMRLDLEEHSGGLSLDIGGLVDGPLNEMLARVLSVGAQTVVRYRADESARADYHIREAFGAHLADPEMFRQYLVSALYGLKMHLPGIEPVADLPKAA